MSQKPSLVFVPGAWHTADTWNKVKVELEAQQFKCVAITLPSTLGDPSVALLDDINAVRDAIVQETTQGHDVVVVMHSYGGAVGQSAIKGLTGQKQDDHSSTEDKSGRVIGLVLMASGFTAAGLSFLGAMGGKPPPSWIANEESGFAELVAEPRELFYHDLPEEEGNYWVGKLTKQSLKVLSEGGEHAYEGWRDVPVWFMSTTDDKTYPLEVQKFVLQYGRDGGIDVTVREVASSHSPMLSMPKESAEFIAEAVASFEKIGHKSVSGGGIETGKSSRPWPTM